MATDKTNTTLLAQSGQENVYDSTFVANDLPPEVQSLVAALFENALQSGLSFEEAVKNALQTALSFGATPDEAQDMIAQSVQFLGQTNANLLSNVNLQHPTERPSFNEREAAFFEEQDSRPPENFGEDAPVDTHHALFSAEKPIFFDGNNSLHNNFNSIPKIKTDLLHKDNTPTDPHFDDQEKPIVGPDTPPPVGAAHFIIPDGDPIKPEEKLITPTGPSTPTETPTETPGQTINSQNSANFLTGGSGDDTLSGGTASDILFGGGGDDTLNGGDGDDRYFFSAGFGNDTLNDTGGNSDKISGFNVENLTSALRQGDDLVLSFYSGDTVTVKNHYQSGSEVEVFVSGNDSYGLNGQTSGVKGQILAGVASTNDSLTGASGDDILFGNDGDDTLIGGAGNDHLFGGAGTDTAQFTGNFADYTVVVFKDGYLVTDTNSSRDGTTVLKDVESLAFADQTLDVAKAVTRPDYVTGVLYDDSFARWNADTNLGDPVALTYSFMTGLPSYYASGEIDSFTTFSSAQETAARSVLSQFSDIANMTFTEVSDSGSGGLLRFGNSTQATSAGFAYSPSVTYTFNSVTHLANDKSGDVFIADNQTSNFTLTDGSHGYFTLIHEIGHATGLMHTFEGTNQLSAATDNTQYSVMSYTNHPKSTVIDVTGTSGSYSYTSYAWNPETPMVYDIATLHYLYGANMTTRTGDDTYTFDPSARMIKTIWDAGGNDTIDASNFTRANVIDLTPGSFSSIGIYNPITDQLPSWYVSADQPTYSGEDNLGIAYGAFIENAKGGSANDILKGNFLDNTLSGGAGDDTLIGNEGDDTLEGGADNDTYSFAANTGHDIINDSGGNLDVMTGFSIADLSQVIKSSNDLILNFNTGDQITLKNHFVSGSEIEIFLSGSDNFGLIGQTSGVVGQIISDPSNSSDLLQGNSGIDYIFGHDGDDTLQGGAGADVLRGGAGSDTFYFETGDGGDSIMDFSHGIDNITIKGSDFGISTIIFETISGTFDGTNATSNTSTIIRDANNNIYVDNNGQTAAGYSHIATIENGAEIDASDFNLV